MSTKLYKSESNQRSKLNESMLVLTVCFLSLAVFTFLFGIPAKINHNYDVMNTIKYLNYGFLICASCYFILEIKRNFSRRKAYEKKF